MKKVITTISFLIVTLITNSQSTIKISDFEDLNNTNWKGTLTYKDYQSGKLQTIDATMQFKISGDKIISNIQYTYEPHKNNKSVIKIKNNGSYFGKEKVISFSNTNGKRILKTKYKAKDNGRKADIIVTHILTDSSYIVSKEVIYLDTKERLIRNAYNYVKI